MALLVPAALMILWQVGFAFDNPSMTSVQVFNEIGYVPFLALLIGIPGAILCEAGFRENEEQD